MRGLPLLLAAGVLLSGCSTFYSADDYVKAQVLSVDTVSPACEENSAEKPSFISSIMRDMTGKAKSDDNVSTDPVANETEISDEYCECDTVCHFATVRYYHPISGKHTLDKVRLDRHTDAKYLMVPLEK